MRNIILDTDIGVDDAFALAYAARTQRLLAITTVFGNVTVEQAVKNARLFCQKMQIEAPVFRGCSRPLAQAPTSPATQVHGSDGLGGVFANSFSGEADNAVDFIIRTINAYPDEITLVAIGPLTNIASAINQAPEMITRVKEVVMMGGAFGTSGHAGNVTPFSEFNIWKDPHAADQVLSSALPIVLVPLDVTHQVLISGEAIRALRQPVLEAISRRYLDYSLQKERFEGMALHDTLTVSWLVNPAWFGVVRSPLRVITEGIASGQTQRQLTQLASRHHAFADCNEQQICLEVDVQAVKHHFLTTLRQ